MRRRSHFGWLEFICGIALILLGVVTLIDPDFALSGLVFAYGIVAVVMGVADIILYVRAERFSGFVPALALISGILSVMSGVMFLISPSAGRWVLAVLFPIWFVAHCISRLAHLPSIRMLAGNGVYYFTLIVNVIGVALGFVMFFSPLLSAMFISAVVSLYLILLGVDSIAVAFSRMGSRY